MAKVRLGGLSFDEFLRRHWQKKPLLARAALPQHADLVNRDRLFTLAARDDLESRLVLRSGRRWHVRQGPFSARELHRLPATGWTLLVQGIDRVLPAAAELLQHFSFLPHARLDDVMASYAPPGGGVGPHFDSYDVFLLQVQGVRRWRVSRQRDLSLVESAPLRILRRFRASGEWLLHPGDMLYLPPRYAHEGTAVTECITCSIGFRAPQAQELATGFLEFLQEKLRLEGIYRDPGLRRPRHPALLDDLMAEKLKRMVDAIRWSAADLERFLGCYLTEPKPDVVFSRPRKPAAPGAFARRAAREGLRLALPTRMLFRRGVFFINGEACPAQRRAGRILRRLADRRRLPPVTAIDRESARWLYQWYRAGYLEIGA
ncbi:MAG TPA: cupin domain-containing protein [Burkholderiales bacterium]|nr:cupin domain-containing protein [Burkholderiales bacterium]